LDTIVDVALNANETNGFLIKTLVGDIENLMSVLGLALEVDGITDASGTALSKLEDIATALSTRGSNDLTVGSKDAELIEKVALEFKRAAEAIKDLNGSVADRVTSIEDVCKRLETYAGDPLRGLDDAIKKCAEHKDTLENIRKTAEETDGKLRYIGGVLKQVGVGTVVGAAVAGVAAVFSGGLAIIPAIAAGATSGAMVTSVTVLVSEVSKAVFAQFKDVKDANGEPILSEEAIEKIEKYSPYLLSAISAMRGNMSVSMARNIATIASDPGAMKTVVGRITADMLAQQEAGAITVNLGVRTAKALSGLYRP